MGRAVLLAAVVHLACLDAPPASTVQDAAALPCERFGTWNVPFTVPGLSTVQGVSPTVDADAHLIVWETSGPDNELAAAIGDGETFVANEGLVADLNTIDPERNPTLSADGLTIWFTRGTENATMLFVSHRELERDPFPPADKVEGVDVGPEAPDVWDDSNEIFFSVLGADFDLAYATCENLSTCTYRGLLPGLDQAMDDLYPTIRSDGLELIFHSSSMNGLVQATRASATSDFELTELLAFPGYDPELTADGRRLYFAIDGQLYRTDRSCIE